MRSDHNDETSQQDAAASPEQSLLLLGNKNNNDKVNIDRKVDSLLLLHKEPWIHDAQVFAAAAHSCLHNTPTTCNDTAAKAMVTKMSPTLRHGLYHEIVVILWKVHHLDISYFQNEAAVYQFVQQRRQMARQILVTVAAHVASGLALHLILEFLNLPKTFAFLNRLERVAPLVGQLAQLGVTSSHLNIIRPRSSRRRRRH